MHTTQPLCEAALARMVSPLWRLCVLPCVESTNTAALLRARAGEAKGLVVLANRQSAGRGRGQKRFFSPPTGVYMSVLLRPETLDPVRLTLGGGVAAAMALRELCGAAVGVHWVNDLMLRERKVGGILCETAGGAAVLGIGINLFPPREGFPPELARRAGSVFLPGDAPPGDARERCVAAILAGLERVEAMSPEDILRAYRAICQTVGREITLPNGEVGRAVAVAQGGELVVRMRGGALRTLCAGVVQARAPGAARVASFSKD